MGMNCPNCGKENADDAKFCQTCGKPLAAYYAAAPPASGRQKQSWTAANWKALVAIVVVVLIVLPLAVFIPVRITVTIINSGDHSVLIIIDDKLMGDYGWSGSPYTTSYHESFAVGVGPHTVVVQHEGIAERTLVMAWPFVGAEVKCTL